MSGGKNPFLARNIPKKQEIMKIMATGRVVSYEDRQKEVQFLKINT